MSSFEPSAAETWDWLLKPGGRRKVFCSSAGERAGVPRMFSTNGSGAARAGAARNRERAARDARRADEFTGASVGKVARLTSGGRPAKRAGAVAAEKLRLR